MSTAFRLAAAIAASTPLAIVSTESAGAPGLSRTCSSA